MKSNFIQEDARLREFWCKRYDKFSLNESGIYGLSKEYIGYYYECKRLALAAAYHHMGIKTMDSFRVLDAGCGQGFFADWLSRSYPQAQYTGVDISENVISHLRAQYASYSWLADNFSRDDFRIAKTFRVIQSIEVLHLILSDDLARAALANLESMLDDAGCLIITDVIPRKAYNPNQYIRLRPRAFYDDVLPRVGMRIDKVIPIYYCIPDRGLGGRIFSRLFRYVPARFVFAFDRLANTIRLPQLFQSYDSKMKMLVCRRV